VRRQTEGVNLLAGIRSLNQHLDYERYSARVDVIDLRKVQKHQLGLFLGESLVAAENRVFRRKDVASPKFLFNANVVFIHFRLFEARECDEPNSAGSVVGLDKIVDESEKAAEDAGQARDALSLAPSWGPGETLITDLGVAAQATIQAANLLKLGAQTLDAETINQAASMMEAAFDAKIAAAGDLVSLEQTVGFSCFR
jgi:hypothetical protein